MEENVLQILSTMNIFKGLTHEDLRSLLGHCSKEVFKKNELVLNEGQPGESLYMTIKGALEVFLPESSNDMNRFSAVVLNRIGPGDCIGEYSLIDSKPVSASVAAREDSVLFRITRKDFETFVSTSDRIGRIIYRNLLFSLVSRLREKDKELDIFSL